MGYAVKIERRIAYIGISNIRDFADHSIDGLVGKIFGAIAPTAGEDLDQAVPDIFVFHAGFIRIRI